MISITPSSSSSKLGPGFLSTATRNYLSARLLFLNNQLFDGGIMAHEATEKIMKAALYLKDGKRGKVREHVIKDLKTKIEKDLEIDLSDYDSLFDYYEVCYNYRYPDNQKPKSFATGTEYLGILDDVFMKLHNLCLDLIEDELVKNRSGVYEQCVEYFTDKSEHKLKILLELNREVSIDHMKKIKDFWHKKGYYKKDGNGVTKFPGGMVTKEH